MIVPARRRSRRAGPARLRGFSLLEVLVAFVILALVATAIFELFGGALRNASAADEWSRAVLVAQSRLAVAASASPLKEGSETGSEDDGRLQWSAKVTPVALDEGNPDAQRVTETMATRLYRIEVDVTFPGALGNERRFSLATLRVGAKEPK
ncbi:MAG TPA: prepilin-type N-terminal cleavage/methylation domain-containing protein [Casimicrobiaceae bacterium]